MSVKQNLGRALKLLLKPLVRLAIQQDITHGDFSEAAKEVYVEMAIRDKNSQKINKSRIAIATGMTRKEVHNVITRAMNADTQSREFSRPSRVLSGWFNDSAYQGPYGIPLEIPYENPESPGAPPCFVHLVKTYSGDMAPRGMLDELMRVGAIAETEDMTVKVLRRDYAPESLSPDLIARLGDVGFNILSTVSSNVGKDTGTRGPFDRVVFSNNRMTKQELEKFDKYLKGRGQAFLEEIDNWFSTNISDKSEDPILGEEFDTGVAMVQYVEWLPDDKGSLRDLLVAHGVSSQKIEN
jgi:hypothetical protein